ncbi:hypothetical protein A2954_06920 [Candidatus Roizmanbacteria bacterium RIFCSPLOWO2_01_FULL_37_12]|uniref:NAD-dependent epimerase/dehydratase domain-containing protein n=1 Tax=Candidatus Roizmanbacteria bacterium RIFCSPLOWO2_01_FULL_37_12 TaxID=1802056 RepID=A0A1F7IE00_9BACT|nr:MAG: hypothetical protein A2954_06920 [Candidatus Roizmanbacteria bacterium RIFCSPLOWO2_01_FULL_37_12]
MKVLVLGGAGYIGAVLTSYLKEKGMEVVVFDNFLYEKNIWKKYGPNAIKADVRNIDKLQPAIDTADAVVNLAAISNDPASDLRPKLTWQVNFKVNETIAKLCRGSHKRVVYASSCSVYGFSSEGEFNEESNMAPVTLYARTKMLSEECYLDKNVDGIILRFATVYGHSPRPRFDLVVNTMIGTSYFENKIVVNGGNQWRPVVHVKDVAQAIYLALISKNHKYRIYNVGSNEQNYRISDLGKIIHNKVPQVKLILNESSIDNRSYKVNFDRIVKDLGFKAKYSIGDAVVEIYNEFKQGNIKNMENDVYYRVKYLKKHTNNGEAKRNFITDTIFKLLF